MFEVDQILIQNETDEYNTRIIVQRGNIANLQRNLIDVSTLSDSELKILNSFVELVNSKIEEPGLK
jgi:hypothetical protein